MKMISKALIIAASMMALAVQASPKIVDIVYIARTPIVKNVTSTPVDEIQTIMASPSQVINQENLLKEKMAQDGNLFLANLLGEENVIGGLKNYKSLTDVDVNAAGIAYRLVFKDGDNYKMIKSMYPPIEGQIIMNEEMEKMAQPVNFVVK